MSSPARAGWANDEESLIGEAESFLLEQCGAGVGRFAVALREIQTTGTYTHTQTELERGCKLAWRNQSRCIGRLTWDRLDVRDCRHLVNADDVGQAAIDHLTWVSRAGTARAGWLRSAITVFAPDGPLGRGPRLRNEQLVRYAGHRLPDGSLVGDPRNETFTGTAMRLGWRPPAEPGRFDVLPLVVLTRHQPPRLVELPAEAVDEVELVHPLLPWFEELGLRWHAVPAISDMILDVGGIHYPVIFSGHYVVFEIVRNLGDPDRYDMLPEIAKRMGLSTSDRSGLWRDRAGTALAEAIWYSYNEKGMRIVGNFDAARQHKAFEQQLTQAGELVSADRDWIVPPMMAQLMPTWHGDYQHLDLSPRLYREPA